MEVSSSYDLFTGLTTYLYRGYNPFTEYQQDIPVYIYLEHVYPPFLGFNPPKQGSNSSKNHRVIWLASTHNSTISPHLFYKTIPPIPPIPLFWVAGHIRCAIFCPTLFHHKMGIFHPPLARPGAPTRFSWDFVGPI